MTDTSDVGSCPREPEHSKLPPFRDPLHYDAATASNCYSTKKVSAIERAARQLVMLLKHIHPSTVVVDDAADTLTGELTIDGLPEDIRYPLPASNRRAVGNGARLAVMFVQEVIDHEVYISAHAVYPEGMMRFANAPTYTLVGQMSLNKLRAMGLADELVSLWSLLDGYHAARCLGIVRAVERLSEAVRWQTAGQILKESNDD